MRLFSLLLSLPLVASGIVYDAYLVNHQEFDYIIIGGGLAGMTVAGRLSEDAGVSVLVIEAGGDSRNDPVVSNAYAYGQAFGRPDLLWQWPTVDGKGLMGGRTLGGSTAINGMTYTRGQRVQYDLLAELLGGNSYGRWNWDGMFAAMKKAESFSAPNDEQRERGAGSNWANHGSYGPVQVTFPNKMYGEQTKAFRTVCNTNFSIPISEDAHGGDAAVVSYFPNMINWRQGDRRSSSVEAYFSPIEWQRDNLKVLLWNRATKILTAGKNDGVWAYGVEFGNDANSPRFTAYARREVIMAAGAIMTPALLQLSGIGPRSVLEGAGVDVVVDLPGVGKNLQEQTMSTIGWSKNVGENINSLSGSIAYPNAQSLFADKAGEIGSRIMGSIKRYAAEAAAAGALVSAAAGEALFGAQADHMVNKGVGLLELFFDNGWPNGGYGINAWNLLPFSRGSVNISSSNPFDLPRLEPRYFAADVDTTIQVQGARMARQIFKSAPLRGMVSGENQPAGEVPDSDTGGSDADWESWIKQRFDSVNHPLGTCSMMLEEYGGVVDGNLRIYHTQNIRVVDASVLPMQMSAHLSATLYGVAENAADIIKARQ